MFLSSISSKGAAGAPKRSSRLRGALLAVAMLQIPAVAQADYVGSRTNRVFLDPASIPALLDGYDAGDEIAYILETTPRDTGSDFGIAAWATVYVPPGVEIIGADYVRPSLGGWVTDTEVKADNSYNGWGSRGSKNYSPDSGTTQLEDGRLTDVNQDIGIFYSTDPRTAGQASMILPQITPTGPDTKPAEIFNQWDYDQVLAFGTGSALSGNKGTGNSPLVSTDGGATWAGTGSPVAGPLTRYTNDYNPACNGAAACTGTTAACAFAADIQCAGPWQRIASPSGRLGGSGAILPATATGAITDTSVVTAAGVTLDGSNPLPASTNAVRFVHGARRLGELEYSRIHFRLTDVSAFLNALNSDSFCLESTGGDTSKVAAKDQPWRYYEPEHRCFQELNGPAENAILQKEVTHVNGCPSPGDFLKAGDVLSFEITLTNISSGNLTQLAFSDKPDSFLTLIEPGVNGACAYPSYDGNQPGPAYNAGTATGGTATWQAASPLAPGESVTVHLCGIVAGNAKVGDVMSNTATANYKLPDDSTEELTSTASGTVAGGLINGRVRLDSDVDGDLNDNDDGIDNVNVTLWHDVDGNGVVSGGDQTLASIATIADGSYYFSGLDPDKYIIQETDPSGLFSTADADTSFGNCGSGNGCNQIAVTLTAGSSSRCRNFLDAPECGNGTIEGGEECDEGQDNGTSGSCCTPQCTFKDAGTLCREADGVCDVPENCTGDSGECPADGVAPTTTVCRTSAGICDVAENCDGDNVDCPADGFVNEGTTCRSSAGVCDVAEQCTGGSAACPADEFADDDTVCRSSAGVCDVAENCTGSSANCPADAFVSSATVCRGSAGVCDVAENCTGSAADCPADGVAGTGVTCRGSAGVCDVAENCDGENVDCPADAFVDSATVCRGSAGVCDVAENCTGSSAACPADAFVSSATVCRDSAGVCDLAENCTGSSAACPADAFQGTAVTCRASAGVCDNAEVCSGSAASCPADSFKSSSTTCRAAAGDCDNAEVCSGSTAACPADGFKPSGTTCTDDTNVCTNDVCNGSGTCTHPNNTAPCNDGAFCTVNDTCSQGQCLGSPRNCADSVECTVDSCNEVADRCDNLPNNSVCGDENSCTIDTCDVQQGCRNVFSCKDICRTPNFYSKRAGNEKDRDNLVQEVLDAVGGINVCGVNITSTSNSSAPWVEGLGLSSALEGLCVRPQRIEERELYRELVAAKLNCAISGSDNCDGVVEEFVDVTFSECDALCSGEYSPSSVDEYESAIARCTHQLACYNGGGQLIGGKCAYGKCDVTDEYCGSDFGACPPIANITFPILQTCKRFPGNCRDEKFCQEGLEICPARTPASGSRACREAKNNDCTIDSCSYNED
jgi:hypothetical protein